VQCSRELKERENPERRRVEKFQDRVVERSVSRTRVQRKAENLEAGETRELSSEERCRENENYIHGGRKTCRDLSAGSVHSAEKSRNDSTNVSERFPEIHSRCRLQRQ